MRERAIISAWLPTRIGHPKPAYTQYQSLIADHADNANIVSNTIPATMVAGRQYYVSVTVKNEGTVEAPESQGECSEVKESQVFGSRYVSEHPP